MNPLAAVLDSSGLAPVGLYVGLFVAASLLMIWRLESLLEHGLEGTALGTVVMPYCSGLGNLIFVALVATRRAPGQNDEVLTNCLVNNVTNLTLLLGLPALLWGLRLGGKKAGKSSARKKAAARTGARGDAGAEQQLTRLSLLLTLCAVVVFAGVTWALGSDGELDRSDGSVLVVLFLFWQAFQAFDVLKHNIRTRRRFGPRFYFDLALVLVAAAGIYSSIAWLVAWLSMQEGAFLNADNLGWLSGWLMVVPNALLAFYYAARRRADIAYASQVGDGHICIPLCIGLSALLQPLSVPAFFDVGIGILLGAALVHAVCVAFAEGLPRWMGWPLLAGYAWFVGAGLG